MMCFASQFASNLINVKVLLKPKKRKLYYSCNFILFPQVITHWILNQYYSKTMLYFNAKLEQQVRAFLNNILDLVFYQEPWKFLSPDIADGVSPIRSRDAVLTVNVPPEKPIIVNGDTLRTTEDREVEIQCVSRGGKPAAEVSIIFQTFTATKHACMRWICLHFCLRKFFIKMLQKKILWSWKVHIPTLLGKYIYLTSFKVSSSFTQFHKV